MKTTNHLDFSGFRATNLADGINPQDAATVRQLDAAVQGYSWKAPVRAATTAAISLNGTQTIDGVALVAGDRVLVKNQASGSANGLYVVAAGAWVRATDFDASSELLGAAVFVSEGTAQGNQQWLMTSDGPLVIGNSALVWAQVGGGASYSQGPGITLSGGVIAVDTAVVARKVSALIGDNSASTITLNHGLGTTDIAVSVQEVSTKAGVLVDWVANGANTVQLTFGTAPTTGQYRAFVVG